MAATAASLNTSSTQPPPQHQHIESSYVKLTKRIIGNFKAYSASQSASSSISARPLTELPEYIKTFTQLISLKGYTNLSKNAFWSLFDIYPKLFEDELSEASGKHQYKNYLGLKNLYKCDVYHHGCFYSASSIGAFRAHLDAEHPKQALYCLYCSNDTGEHQNDRCHGTFNRPEQLIDHIKSEHSHLNFQCNLCLYRAFSAEHIFFHQAMEHVTEFERSLARAIRDKVDDFGELTPIETAFIQLHDDEGRSDDETEVEDNGSDDSPAVSSNKPRLDSRAKIIDCGDYSLDGDNRRAMLTFLQKYAAPEWTQHPISNKALKEPQNSVLPCVYCPLGNESIQEGNIINYFHHHATAHPGLPFLAGDLKELRKTFGIRPIGIDEEDEEEDIFGDDFDDSLSIMDEDIAKQIVSDFRERLGKDSRPRTYSEELMQDVFECYQSLDWTSENFVESTTDDEPTSDQDSNISSQGLKRKRDDDVDDVDEEQDEAEEGQEEEGVSGDVVDLASISEQQQPSPNKRRRLLPNFHLPTFSDSAIRRTKRVATAVATAAAALGFYHLTHYLPDSVQTYLN